MLSFFDFFRRRLWLRDLLDMYIVDNKSALCHDYQQKLRCNVGLWLSNGGHPDARQIQTEHFATVRAAMMEINYSPHTAESVIRGVRAVLRHAHQRGLLRQVPAQGRKLKIIYEPKPAVPLSHLAAVYRAAIHAQSSPRGYEPITYCRAYLVLSYNTGLRITDVSHVRWADWDRANNMLKIVARKTGKSQPLPVVPILADHLDALPRIGERMLPIPAHDRFRKQLNRLADIAGVPHFTPHSIRRRTGCEYELAHPGAGSLILGHTMPSAVTWQSYIGAAGILAAAAAKIPQPWGLAELAKQVTEG